MDKSCKIQYSYILINILIILFLVSIMFLKFSVIPMLAIFFIILAYFFLFMRRLKIKKVVIIVLLNFLYWFFSGLISGGIELNSFSIEYIQNEGRIFLYYLPILVFSLFSLHRKVFFALDKIIQFITIMNFVLLIAWGIFSRIEILSIGKDFAGFITSHTAAGTFFGTLVLYNIIKYIYIKNINNFIYMFISFFPLLFSSSRQALIAVIGVYFFYIIEERKYLHLIKIITIMVLVLNILSYVEVRSIDRVKSLFSMELLNNIPTAYDRAHQIQTSIEESVLARDLSTNESIVNALNRIFLWARAIHYFIDSPLLGIGFGRFNDVDNKLYGIQGFFNYAINSSENVYTVTSAHNSYLHILAENGLVGLLLILYFWFYLYKHFKKYEYENYNLKDFVVHYRIARYMVIYICINALFGHAFAAPAVGFTALTLIAVIFNVKPKTK